MPENDDEPHAQATSPRATIPKNRPARDVTRRIAFNGSRDAPQAQQRQTIMFPRPTALALLTSVLTACGPVPGGSLEGTLSAPPSDWSEVLGGDRAFCEIESRPGQPHSIQLECFVYDSRLYVQSHRWALAPWWPTQSWAAIWIEEPDVLVRKDSSLFELRAVHVTLASERNSILESRGYDPVPDGIAVFRFDDRD